MKTTNEILNEIFKERNSSPKTQKLYRQSVAQFEIFSNKKLEEILLMALNEEKQKTAWRDSTLRAYLIDFRIYLYEKYKTKTAKLYLTLIISIFRHLEFVVPQLPRYSANIQILPILPEDIPDREMLQQCIDIAPIEVQTFVPFTSSSGMSRQDALNLSIGDYLEATKEYHNNTGNVIEDIKTMNSSDVDIIPVFRDLTRQKTGVPYFTFASPEAAKAVNNYLISRRVLIYDENDKVVGSRDVTSEDSLFDISYQYLGNLFKEINEKLKLGKAGRYNRFTPHMLRKYHATQLHAAGMTESKIDILQGRTPNSVIHESYIRVKVEDLKQEYIDCLPYINDINKVRTKLDVEIEKNIELENELSSKKREIESMNDRLSTIENMIYANDGLIEAVDKFKK